MRLFIVGMRSTPAMDGRRSWSRTAVFNN